MLRPWSMPLPLPLRSLVLLLLLSPYCLHCAAVRGRHSRHQALPGGSAHSTVEGPQALPVPAARIASLPPPTTQFLQPHSQQHVEAHSRIESVRHQESPRLALRGRAAPEASESLRSLQRQRGLLTAGAAAADPCSALYRALSRAPSLLGLLFVRPRGVINCTRSVRYDAGRELGNLRSVALYLRHFYSLLHIAKRSPDPHFPSQYDVLGVLEKLKTQKWSSAEDFYNALILRVRGLNDAHTAVRVNCPPFSHVLALPLVVVSVRGKPSVQTAPQELLSSIVTEAAASAPFNFNAVAFQGARVLRINGQDAWATFKTYVNTRAGYFHDLGQRINWASVSPTGSLGAYNFRFINPGADSIRMQLVRPGRQSPETINVPWLTITAASNLEGFKTTQDYLSGFCLPSPSSYYYASSSATTTSAWQMLHGTKLDPASASAATSGPAPSPPNDTNRPAHATPTNTHQTSFSRGLRQGGPGQSRAPPGSLAQVQAGLEAQVQGLGSSLEPRTLPSGRRGTRELARRPTKSTVDTKEHVPKGNGMHSTVGVHSNSAGPSNSAGAGESERLPRFDYQSPEDLEVLRESVYLSSTDKAPPGQLQGMNSAGNSAGSSAGSSAVNSAGSSAVNSAGSSAESSAESGAGNSAENSAVNSAASWSKRGVRTHLMRRVPRTPEHLRQIKQQRGQRGQQRGQQRNALSQGALISTPGDLFPVFLLSDEKTAVVCITTFAPEFYYGDPLVVFLQEAMRALLLANSSAEQVLLDLSGNGGGYTILGPWLATMLLGSDKYPHPRSSMQSDFKQFLADTSFTAAMARAGAGRYNWDRYSTPNEVPFSPVNKGSFFFPLQRRRFGPTGEMGRYSSLFKEEMASLAEATGKTYNPILGGKAFALLSDGDCFSTCDTFSTLLTQRFGVKTVTVGGIPGRPMGFSGGGGGFIIGDVESDMLQYFPKELVQRGDAPRAFTWSMYMSMRFAHGYFSQNSKAPMEFTWKQGNTHVDYTPENLADRSILLLEAAKKAF